MGPQNRRFQALTACFRSSLLFPSNCRPKGHHQQKKQDTPWSKPRTPSPPPGSGAVEFQKIWTPLSKPLPPKPPADFGLRTGAIDGRAVRGPPGAGAFCAERAPGVSGLGPRAAGQLSGGQPETPESASPRESARVRMGAVGLGDVEGVNKPEPGKNRRDTTPPLPFFGGARCFFLSGVDVGRVFFGLKPKSVGCRVRGLGGSL